MWDPNKDGKTVIVREGGIDRAVKKHMRMLRDDWRDEMERASMTRKERQRLKTLNAARRRAKTS